MLCVALTDLKRKHELNDECGLCRHIGKSKRGGEPGLQMGRQQALLQAQLIDVCNEAGKIYDGWKKPSGLEQLRQNIASSTETLYQNIIWQTGRSKGGLSESRNMVNPGRR